MPVRIMSCGGHSVVTCTNAAHQDAHCSGGNDMQESIPELMCNWDAMMTTRHTAYQKQFNVCSQQDLFPAESLISSHSVDSSAIEVQVIDEKKCQSTTDDGIERCGSRQLESIWAYEL